MARLVEQDQDLGEAALEWLRSNQLSDGSWGTENPICYHDRVICTLSALTALGCNRTQDTAKKLIEKGKKALKELTRHTTPRLMANPPGATVGFEMLAPALLSEAVKLGILTDQGEQILEKTEHQRTLKKIKLSGKKIDRNVTAAFSVEMVGEDLSPVDIVNLQETNGSVAYSPSATAFYLLRINPNDQAALDYLNRTMNEGAVPYVAPLDIFERSWSLWNLALTDWSYDLSDTCRHHLDWIEKGWVAGVGIGTATGLSLVDGDDTAMTFEAMLHWGRLLDTDALFIYESDENFRCFPLEVDPSTSTNIHILSALKAAGYDDRHPAVQKIYDYLIKNRMPDGMWVDKWHLSPFYPSAHAIIACSGNDDEIIRRAVHELLVSQGSNGAWGKFQPTAEETAYALQALCIWKKNGHPVEGSVLRAGAKWLVQHFAPPYPPLWIGKCLYCPERVVRSAILSALGLVFQELRGEL